MSMHPPPIFITTAPIYPDSRVFSLHLVARQWMERLPLTPDTHFERNKTMDVQPAIDACVDELMRHANQQ